MHFPLQIRFKLFALAPQIDVEDAQGGTVGYVKQRLFRLREKVEIFADDSRSRLLCTIEADRIIDFNACYRFRAADGTPLGSVRRRGLRSLWRANYEVTDAAGRAAFVIREDNPVAKIFDGLLGDIPVVGLFSGFFFNPRYAVLRDGEKVMMMIKHRTFLESRFEVQSLSPIGESDQLAVVVALLMFVLLERSRG